MWEVWTGSKLKMVWTLSGRSYLRWRGKIDLDMNIQCDNIFEARRPHLILVNKKEKWCLIMLCQETTANIIRKLKKSELKREPKNRNLSTAWIDYKKAFNSVPHDWIIKILKIHKLDATIVKFFEHIMPNWKTSMVLNHKNGKITTPFIWFKQLASSKVTAHQDLSSFSPSYHYPGYCVKSTLATLWNQKKISHLYFMDDLKLFASNDSQLESQIKIVKKI